MDLGAELHVFANSQGFFPPYTSQLTGGSYSSSQLLSGFAKAATNTQISPMNAKNWATADATDLIIPTMMKQLMKGAQLRLHGGRGQHPAAERPQQRQPGLAGLVSAW